MSPLFWLQPIILTLLEDPVIIDLSMTESLLLTPNTSEQYALPSWLAVSFSLFFVGVTGMVLNWKNFLIVMMCIEIMYLGPLTGFILYGIVFHDVVCAIYALLILIFAACESAVGLGLLVVARSYEDTLALIRGTLGG